MGNVGKGIAFAGLCIGAAWLEVTGHEASGLWLVVVLWWLFGDFDGCKCSKAGG